MSVYNVGQAQTDYYNELEYLRSRGIILDENQQAVVFAKILVRQTAYGNPNVTFCSDNELFVSKTLTGYDVVGYYIDYTGARKPFNVTVCKIENFWYPSKRYVGADTKSCSGSILLWILLMLGCSLAGILMYFIMSSAIGI